MIHNMKSFATIPIRTVSGVLIALFVYCSSSSPAGPQLEDVALDSHPAWSPDGTRIAFARTVGGRSVAISVMNADGSNLSDLTFPGSPVFDLLPSWSPDGFRIAFDRSRGAIFNPDTGEFDPATVLPTIYVMIADGSGVTPL
ncbi:PD40 domain-containing protein, partial [candidate division KSB1 bacterium]|nr:PD40 domain-containing protein [candidate division KSB1 bacterium]